MKLRRLIAVPAMLALGATPFAAHAYGSDTAASACIQAFVDTYLPKDRTVQVRRLPPGHSLGTYSRQFTNDLSARLSRSGNELVAARCVASAGGEVLELQSLPATPAAGSITTRSK